MFSISGDYSTAVAHLEAEESENRLDVFISYLLSECVHMQHYSISIKTLVHFPL